MKLYYKYHRSKVQVHQNSVSTALYRLGVKQNLFIHQILSINEKQKALHVWVMSMRFNGALKQLGPD